MIECDDDVLAFERMLNGQRVVVALNLGDAGRTVDALGGTTLLLSSLGAASRVGMTSVLAAHEAAVVLLA